MYPSRFAASAARPWERSVRCQGRESQFAVSGFRIWRTQTGVGKQQKRARKSPVSGLFAAADGEREWTLAKTARWKTTIFEGGRTAASGDSGDAFDAEDAEPLAFELRDQVGLDALQGDDLLVEVAGSLNASPRVNRDDVQSPRG